MAILCFKKLTSSTPRLGQLLKCAREKKDVALKTAAEKTRIPEKYLALIENGTFDKLPQAQAYRIAYIRSYAHYLNLDHNECVAQFTREEGLQNAQMIHPLKRMRHFPFGSISIFLRNGVAICLLMVFAGYLTWQIRGILEPPALTVFSPAEGTVITSASTLVEGITEAESLLAVNGQEVVMNKDGKFQAELNLVTGLNTITIASTKKKHRKTTTITRHVIVRLNQVTAERAGNKKLTEK
jgi:cytoskeletal protein RodZ